MNKNELKIFENENLGSVRVIEKDNNIYLMLGDVCNILGIANVSQVKIRLLQDGVITNEVIDNLGRSQQATFINEANFYKVVFQSRMPKAEEFTNWVAEDVLPSIRQKGVYAMDEDALILQSIQILTRRDEENRLKIKEQQEQLKLKDSIIEEQTEDVQIVESITSAVNSVLIRDLAKMLQQNGFDIGQNQLFTWLRRYDYLTNNNTPTQMSMNLGIMEHTTSTYCDNYGNSRIAITPRVTGKGITYFIKKFKKDYKSYINVKRKDFKKIAMNMSNSLN